MASRRVGPDTPPLREDLLNLQKGTREICKTAPEQQAGRTRGERALQDAELHRPGHGAGAIADSQLFEDVQ
jgi:hypothetical protein